MRTIGLLLAIVGITFVLTVSALAEPTPDLIRQAQIENSLASMRMWQNVRMVAVPSLALLFLAGIAGGVRWVWRKAGQAQLVHAEAGLYPAMVFDRSTLSDRMTGRRRITTHDPNRAMASTLSITTQRDGAISVQSDTPAERWPNQVAVTTAAIGVQNSQAQATALRAPKGKTVADWKAQKGWYDNPPMPKPAQIIQPLALPAPQVKRLDVTDALAQSTGIRWIVGQADDGRVAAFEPGLHAHAAIVGATGTGKTTSVGFSIALAALRAGWHVVILDPDGGTNWQPFASRAEWHETDRDSFPGQVAAVHRVYEMRTTANRPQPIICIIEEYGDMIRQLQTVSRSDAEHVNGMLDSILQRGRKRAMHLVFVDQYPEHWSQAIVGGTKFRAVFQLGPNQGAKMEEYKAASLPDVGRFLVRGTEYSSFNAEYAVPDILRRLPAPGAKRVINGSVSSSVSSSVAVRSGVTPPIQPYSEPSEPSAPAGPTDYQQEAIRYIASHPQCTQTDLRNQLGISKAYANELWHTYHPLGNNYAPSPPPTHEDGREIIDLNSVDGVDEIKRIDWRKVSV